MKFSPFCRPSIDSCLSRRHFVLGGVCGAAGLLVPGGALRSQEQRPQPAGESRAAVTVTGAKLVEAAREQVGKTLVYDPAYVTLSYPLGDVPLERGVCADVVIRALRRCGVDLQKEVHEDMKAAFSAYPKVWGLKRPDRNIDHRRVLNLAVYFRRKGFALPVTSRAEDYLPGDLVTCTVAGKLPHIVVVSDRRNADGTPLILHNIGQGAQEEDRLFAFPLNGHFRWKQPPAA